MVNVVFLVLFVSVWCSSTAFLVPQRRRLVQSVRLEATQVGPHIPIDENYQGLRKVHSNPDIFVIENFLDPEFCRDLIQRAKQKTLEPSPVAYAGWTQDFRDLVELAAKGPVSWLAILGAWFQTKDSENASQLDLVVNILRNYAFCLVLAVAFIAAFTTLRAESLKEMRTSTSTTLDDVSDTNSGTAVFVRKAAALLGGNNAGVEAVPSKQAALFEAPTVIRYEKGQVLKPHYDANRSAATEDANRGGQTLATLLVYLNDVEEGGLTRFGKLPALGGAASNNNPDASLTVQPRMGDALLFFPADQAGVFDERTEHEGCPAVDEKWIARIWRHTLRVPPPFGLSDQSLALL